MKAEKFEAGVMRNNIKLKISARIMDERGELYKIKIDVRLK